MEYASTLPIERASGLTADDFYRSYLTGRGRPVIVTDALDDWAARSKWSLEWCRAQHGSRYVTFKGLVADRTMVMKLSDYLDYLDTPLREPPGFWINRVTGHPEEAPDSPYKMPLYLAWDAFPRHPEFLEDIRLRPAFLDDWLQYLPQAFHSVLNSVKNYFSAGLLIGPAGASFGLHQDVLDTHAYLAQLEGRKRFVLYSPDKTSEGYEGTLEPGELLFIPSRWWHHVTSVDKTLTVNYNFANRHNFAAYLTCVLQEMPEVLAALESSPDAKAALGIQWQCLGFAKPGER